MPRSRVVLPALLLQPLHVIERSTRRLTAMGVAGSGPDTLNDQNHEIRIEHTMAWRGFETMYDLLTVFCQHGMRLSG